MGGGKPQQLSLQKRRASPAVPSPRSSPAGSRGTAPILQLPSSGMCLGKGWKRLTQRGSRSPSLQPASPQVLRGAAGRIGGG